MKRIESRTGRSVATFFVAAAALGLMLGVGGCTLIPNYQQPKPPVPNAWPDGPAYQDDTQPAGTASASSGKAPTAAADIGWRDFYTDPLLQKFIELTLKQNPDARTAAANVAAAQAQYRIQRADLFPSISASAIEQTEKYPTGVSTNSLGGGGSSGNGGSGTSSSVTAISGITRFYDVGLGFTAYEIDLFGRIRSLDRERLEEYYAYVEDERSARISLVAEFGNLYLSYLAHLELYRVTVETLKDQQQSYDLVKLKYDSGVATALDLRQAEVALDTAKSNLEQSSRQTAQDFNAFVLVGAEIPKDLPAGLTFDEYDFVAELPAGLPSQILQQRPDVLAAEHRLKAANADIGAARAAFFPSITLTGSYGTASRDLSGLFGHGSNSWTFSPQINLPIFTAGANIATLDLAKIQKDSNIATYEKTVENAFYETANLLAARGTLNRELAADRALADAAADAYKLSEMRFRSGVDNYLSVLDSQRTLYNARLTVVNVKLERLQNLSNLYKALGGGWKEHTGAALASVAIPAPALALATSLASDQPRTDRR